MAASMEPYEKWLCEKLLQLNSETDTDVFVSYIIGILEGECDEEEQTEALSEFLLSIVESGSEEASAEILNKWKDFQAQNKTDTSNTPKVDNADKLSEIFEKQKLQTAKVKSKSVEDSARKENILYQYSMVSSGSESEESEEESMEMAYKTPASKGGKHVTNIDDFLATFKNTNSEDVAAKERSKRDAAKAEADRKKEKDKNDRDHQKNKQAERKEAEKKRTQKGERRR